MEYTCVDIPLGWNPHPSCISTMREGGEGGEGGRDVREGGREGER